jgi:dolichol-phosphate mannosyltransferase
MTTVDPAQPAGGAAWVLPDVERHVFRGRATKYCVVVPVLDENGRLTKQLGRMRELGIPSDTDIVIADGGSRDGSTDPGALAQLGVRALLVMRNAGGQSAQLRGAFAFCLTEGYEGIITVDGNNKDGMESIPQFVAALERGIDYAQGSRFLAGAAKGYTPPVRSAAIRCIHAPVVSLVAGHRLTDTTNGFRAYHRRYLLHPDVQPFRALFRTYELNHYLSARASRLGLAVAEIPVQRTYPKRGPVPTKISPLRGNLHFLRMLLLLVLGCYNPGTRAR